MMTKMTSDVDFGDISRHINAFTLFIFCYAR